MYSKQFARNDNDNGCDLNEKDKSDDDSNDKKNKKSNNDNVLNNSQDSDMSTFCSTKTKMRIKNSDDCVFIVVSLFLLLVFVDEKKNSIFCQCYKCELLRKNGSWLLLMKKCC